MRRRISYRGIIFTHCLTSGKALGIKISKFAHRLASIAVRPPIAVARCIEHWRACTAGAVNAIAAVMALIAALANSVVAE
jgi:hypothetical protein